MPYTQLFFDLDDTLYPSTNGLWNLIRQRMNDYMLEVLRIPPEQVAILRRQYFEAYGTTLRGLQIHYQVDADDFLAYVHDLPVESILSPDAELRRLLQGSIASQMDIHQRRCKPCRQGTIGIGHRRLFQRRHRHPLHGFHL